MSIIKILDTAIYLKQFNNHIGKITNIYCAEGGYSFSHIGETKTFNFEVEYDNPTAEYLESICPEVYDDPNGVYKVIDITNDSITVECVGVGSTSLYVHSSGDFYVGQDLTVEFLYASITNIDVDTSSIIFSYIGEEIFVSVFPTYDCDAPIKESWTVDPPSSEVWEITGYEHTADGAAQDGFRIKCKSEGNESIWVYACKPNGDMYLGKAISVSYEIPEEPDYPSEEWISICITNWDQLVNEWGSSYNNYDPISINSIKDSYGYSYSGDQRINSVNGMIICEYSVENVFAHVGTKFTVTATINPDPDLSNSFTVSGTGTVSSTGMVSITLN